MASAPVGDLLRLAPAELLGVLESLQLPSSSDWDLLREAAGGRAVAGALRAEKKAWAAVAVHAAAQMKVSDAFDRNLAARHVATLRAALISQLGDEPGDPILDLDDLLRWFVDEVEGLDPDREWPLPSTPIEDLRAGRHIKNALTALAPVTDDPRFSDRTAMSTVRRWRERFEGLP